MKSSTQILGNQIITNGVDYDEITQKELFDAASALDADYCAAVACASLCKTAWICSRTLGTGSLNLWSNFSLAVEAAVEAAVPLIPTVKQQPHFSIKRNT